MKQWELFGLTDDPASPMRQPVLVRSDEPARALVDQVPGMMWTTNRQLRFTSFVGRGVGRLGLGPNQIVGTGLAELFETSSAAFDAVTAHRRALRGETVSLWLTWGSVSLHAVVAPLRDAGQETIGIIGVALEVRERAPAPGREAAEPLSVVG
ncbi:MAG TPA: PAS domain-containing protein [Actinomycetota bacterium]|nr:PAS domain-containing protein [Actinomycetota bacterium]